MLNKCECHECTQARFTMFVEELRAKRESEHKESHAGLLGWASVGSNDGGQEPKQ